VTVTAVDAFGNTTPGYTGTVHFGSTDAGATLPADYTFVAADSGSHTFTNGVTLVTAGSQLVSVAASGMTSASSTVAVSPAVATSLSLAAPTTVFAGSGFSVTLTAKDAYGNTATGYTGKVHFTSSDAAATLPADYTFTSGDAGVHTFSGVTLDTAGSQTVTVTDPSSSSLTGSATVAVSPAAASVLRLAAPGASTAGSALTVTVTALDAFGNITPGYAGTVHFTSTDGGVTLPPDYTFVAADGGSHTFTNGVTLVTAGSQSITVAATGMTSANSTVTVSPAAASHLGMIAPSASTAGSAFTVTVTALDAYGNTATGYLGKVNFTSSDGQATLPADYTFTSSDTGTHTFTGGVTLDTAGNQTVTATDSASSSVTGSATVAVNPGAAIVLRLAAPAASSAGSAFTVTVTVVDAFGNVTPSYSGTVHFTSTDAGSTLPADYTFVAADGGSHTFTNGVTLVTAGSQSIKVAASGMTGATSTLAVSPAPASHLAVAAPGASTAGSTFTVTVTALDPYGNTATGYLGNVHFTSSDGQVTLPADYTFTSTDAGVHAFSSVLMTAGSQSVTATDTSASSITGTAVVAVSPAAAASITVAGFPSPTTAGAAHSFTVTARDAYGNIATGYTGTLHFTSPDAQAVLPADGTLTNGSGSFSATLKTAGSQSLTATDTITASLTGTEAGIAVTPAAAASLVLTGYPSPTTAGAAHTFTVTAKDAYGNVATGYSGTVHFTSSDAQAALPANATLTNGTGSFTATLKTAGSQSLTATDTAAASLTSTQTGISVTAAAAASFVVSGYASPTTAGTAQVFTVTARDAFGNVAAGYTGTVHSTSSDVQAALPPNYTFTAADAGVHTFTATLKTAGSQSLTATDTVTASIAGSQSGITVTPAAATHLRITAPSSVNHNTPFSITVVAMDAYGNVATGYRGTIHFTSSDNRAMLPANYRYVAGDNGTHTFTVTLRSRGLQSITATDIGSSSIAGSVNVQVV
jgi:FKBP-type peptidyl-prolyl cis-trans isomerase 2